MATPSTFAMNVDFSSVHNHHERLVFEAVLQRASDYPYLDAQVLPDVACVALTRMGSRYIRHAVDLTFNMTAKQRTALEENLHDSVTFAFELVQTRIAMRARRRGPVGSRGPVTHVTKRNEDPGSRGEVFPRHGSVRIL